VIKDHFAPVEKIVEGVLLDSVEVSLGFTLCLCDVIDHGEEHLQFDFIVFLDVWVVAALNH